MLRRFFKGNTIPKTESWSLALFSYPPRDMEISLAMGFNPCPGAPGLLIRFAKRKRL